MKRVEEGIFSSLILDLLSWWEISLFEHEMGYDDNFCLSNTISLGTFVFVKWGPIPHKTFHSKLAKDYLVQFSVFKENDNHNQSSRRSVHYLVHYCLSIICPWWLKYWISKYFEVNVHGLVLIIIIKESLFKFWETGSVFLWNRALEDTEFQQNVWGWDVGVLGTWRREKSWHFLLHITET